MPGGAAEALFEPAEGTRHDWQIFKALRDRMEPNGNRKIPLKYDFFKRLPPHKILDLGLRFGPYGLGDDSREEGEDSLKLRQLRKAPHGIDLGPLQPCLPQRLVTPSRKIELAPAVLVDDLNRVRKAFLEDEQAQNGHLSLIGRRHLRSNNSWMHNSKRLVKGKDRCTLLIHPDDAAKRNVTNDQLVKVASRVGSVQLKVEVSGEMMPGVVSIPHGWGHGRDGVQLETAVQHAGVSLNDLTDECALDELTGNAAFNGISVTVQPVG